MTIPPLHSPFFRAFLGSILLLGCLFVVSACGTSEPVQKKTTRTLQLTAYDSTSGEPLDSARAVERTFGDSLNTDSAGTFVVKDPKPALYVFDVGGYGYHTQRHVSVLMEPDDTTLSANIPLLPKQLQIDCEGSRPFNWKGLISSFRKDTTRVRIQLIDVFAEDGTVRIQPVAVNDLPTSTLFLPDNFGALGHYEVSLYDANNNRISYTYQDSPTDEKGSRIYTKEDILPVVPQDAQRLAPSKLNVSDSISDGQTLWTRIKYVFSPNDTLQATSATTFPDLNIDSLQVPVYDTLRTDGRVHVADSLVLQRDTTQMRIVGVDTTVTRSGYLLFSTLRDSNAVSSPKAAKNLLYVPDSVKKRARRDSLLASVKADSTVPPIDTAAIYSPDTKLRVVDRTATNVLDSLLTDVRLTRSLAEGLPNLDANVNDLLSLSAPLRESSLETPTLDRDTVRRGLDLRPDSTFRDSVLLSVPRSDSLFRLFDPDTSAVSDTADGLAARNPFLTGEFDSLTPDVDSVSLDALDQTIPLNADTVVTESVIKEYVQDPPAHTYWYVPDSLSIANTQVMVVDSSFFKLRSRSRVDTSATIDIASQLPKRVGPRDQITIRKFPQQVIRSPAGTYRRTYLTVWRRLQANELQENYCQIFPFPLRSEWRSTTMRR